MPLIGLHGQTNKVIPVKTKHRLIVAGVQRGQLFAQLLPAEFSFNLQRQVFQHEKGFIQRLTYTNHLWNPDGALLRQFLQRPLFIFKLLQPLALVQFDKKLPPLALNMPGQINRTAIN